MKIKKTNIIKYFFTNDSGKIDDFKKYFNVDEKSKIKKIKTILNGLVKEKVIYKEKDLYKPYLFAIDKDLQYIIKKIKINPYFPKKVIDEAVEIFQNYEKDIENEKIKKERVNLCDLFTVTMDGLNAKDFDDAIALLKEDDNYKLFVHIADVSHYVKIGSSLDKEALKRGNSYYFAKCVIPMFPFELSNIVCSLNEGVERLTVTVELIIDKRGDIISSKFYNSIINVKKRIPYEIGNQLIKDKNNQYFNFLNLCLELKNILYKKRIENNSIDFDLPEIEIEFKKSNIYPDNIYKYIRGETERIIEEFMLIANQAVAKYLQDKAPLIFRVHDSPPEEKREIVYKYLDLMGIKRPRRYNQREINEILELIRGKKEEKLLSSYILRSMSQAIYSDKNIGHFGLNFEDYTHFTSPIRRYSDLIIHRILKAVLAGKRSPYDENKLKKIAEYVSFTERNATEAERDFLKLKGAKFLKDKKNFIFKAFVSGIIEDGIFFELEDYGIEGFVPSFILNKKGYFFDNEYLVYVKKDYKEDRNNQSIIKLGDYFNVSIFYINEKRGFVDLKIEEKLSD
ncbi:MAG: VacB/RNase II family 3'-5' exoribonuclease [Spirochaetes bacterium]|nr:VacB/RNase II family 3'-5' exoribonuclease [Spirochaetota bacterium]